MKVDVIILTKSDSDTNIGRTKQTIQTIYDSDPDTNFIIHVVETLPHRNDIYDALVKNTICPNEPFNYNRFLNKAFDYITSEWVVITNNDVRYERNWFNEILKVHEERPDIQSFSPKDPALYALYFDGHFLGTQETYFENYKVSEGLMGWSLVIHRDALNKIRPFDESFDMYYQDNDYAEMLKLHGIKHALVRNSLAIHYGTFEKVIPNPSQIKKMEQGERTYINKWGRK